MYVYSWQDISSLPALIIIEALHVELNSYHMHVCTSNGLVGIVTGIFFSVQVPVTSWFDDTNDTELLDLIPFFEALNKVDNVLTVLGQNSQPQTPTNSGQYLTN